MIIYPLLNKSNILDGEVLGCKPRASDVRITWMIRKVQIPGLHPKLNESELVGVGTGKCVSSHGDVCETWL